MAKIVIWLIKFYQLTIGKILPPACRYSPTCSQYMIDAVKKNGAFFGFLQGLKRIGRCHPWSNHNHWDPVK
jgi:uncharacterized protein